jgi:hypothetical protein
MGKNRKYGKTDQNNEQSNKSSSNESVNNNNNHGNKISNNGTEINNKNDLLSSKDKNNLKKDESSISTILFEILDAARYFFIMCKNFLIPSGIPFKIFASFLLLEILYQGITIYLIKSVNHLLEELFAIWNNFIHIYIYIVSNIQMIYIFICEGLLIFRFIHLKIYLFKKFNWLINILSFIIIIFNLFEIKDLNYKIHRFYTKNLDNFASKNKIIKDNIVNEYINLHINRNEDFQHYEFCYELKTDINIISQIKNQFPNIKWSYNTYTDIYTGCRNLTFQNETLLEINSNNFFFKCDNKIDINTAPNVCVSSKYRQKRFYAQIRMALYEILILILWNLYNAFSMRIIYKYYPNLKSEKTNYSEYDNYSRKNQNSHNNKYPNQTITFKDINDKEINNVDNREEEEEEDEDEYEEEDEESIKKEEKNQKDGFVKVFKMRKISKRKMKNYKKKNKKRYKEEKMKNKNIYFDDEILNLNYFNAKFDNDEDSLNNNEDEKEEYFIKNNKLNGKDENKKKKSDNKDKNKIKSDSDSDSDSDTDSETESDDSNDDNNSAEQLEENDEVIEDNNMEQIHLLNSLKRKVFENIEKYQWGRRLWKFLSDKITNLLKNKIRYIFLNLDKNLREKEKEN